MGEVLVLWGCHGWQEVVPCKSLAEVVCCAAARDRIQEIAQKNAKFKAIDRAIGRNSLKIVTLLRLSPLLPLALSNYLYGLTSVDLGSYVLGSWAGMLPGTIAYVAAGTLREPHQGHQEST